MTSRNATVYHTHTPLLKFSGINLRRPRFTWPRVVTLDRYRDTGSKRNAWMGALHKREGLSRGPEEFFF